MQEARPPPSHVERHTKIGFDGGREERGNKRNGNPRPASFSSPSQESKNTHQGPMPGFPNLFLGAYSPLPVLQQEA